MKKTGFTLIELMVVILIVGILAAASIPLMRGRIDSAKWSTLTGTLSTGTLQARLGFNAADLTGTYFAPGDFTVDTVSDDGVAEITVTSDGTGKKPAAGSYVLKTNGDWAKK